MSRLVVVDGVEMTVAAAENLREVGMGESEIAADLTDLRAGMRRERLCAKCCAGADADRISGWRDYVQALVDHLHVHWIAS